MEPPHTPTAARHGRKLAPLEPPPFTFTPPCPSLRVPPCPSVSLRTTARKSAGQRHWGHSFCAFWGALSDSQKQSQLSVYVPIRPYTSSYGPLCTDQALSQSPQILTQDTQHIHKMQKTDSLSLHINHINDITDRSETQMAQISGDSSDSPISPSTSSTFTPPHTPHT